MFNPINAELNPILFNPLNAELNPVRHLLTLLGAHHILHVSRIRVSVPGVGSFGLGFLVSANDFTFSEPCIVIRIREKDQSDARLSSLIYSD